MNSVVNIKKDFPDNKREGDNISYDTEKNEPQFEPLSINLGDFTKITDGLACSLLIINIFLPGVGTMIAGQYIDGVFGKTIIYKGIIQLITSPCLVGWVWSIYTGIGLCRMASGPKAQNFNKVNQELNTLALEVHKRTSRKSDKQRNTVKI